MLLLSNGAFQPMAMAGIVISLGAAAVAQSTTLQLAPQGKYAGMGLDAPCEAILYREFECHEVVGELGQQRYHGSVGDQSFTDSICATKCASELNLMRRRVMGTCRRTPDLVSGFPVVSLVDSIMTGWNETCQKDKETGEYCNTIIEAFEDVDELEDMPRDELCSYCYGARLRMMQASPYSAYNEMYASMLQFVNRECGVDSPTEVLPDPIDIEYPESERCEEIRRYTVREGDTCDSIAESQSVSSATLYYINQNLSNCSEPTPGLELCLPDQCETTHTLTSKDETCVDVALLHNVLWTDLIESNAGVNSRCTNIWSTEPFWGRVLCASSPGGEFVPRPPPEDSLPGNGNTGGPGGGGDGYSDVIVPRPEGDLAEGTTEVCGYFVQAEEGKGCESYLARSAVTMQLFLDANPSLGTVFTECSENLVVGKWYCLHPHWSFKKSDDS